MKAKPKYQKSFEIHKSRDRESGLLLDDRFYMKATRDVSFKKGDCLTLFPVDKDKLKERMSDLVSQGKLTEEIAESILNSSVFDVSFKPKA